MNRFHALAVYGTLLVLLVLQFAHAPAAFDTQQARAQSMPAPSTLGPAASVELVDPAGETLSLRARDGRLAWSDRPTARTLSIGVVSIGDIMKDLMQAAGFNDDGEKRKEEYDAKYREYMAKAEEIRKRMGGMSPGDPHYNEASEEYQQIKKEYETWRDAETKAVNKRDAAAVGKAFEEFHAAVEVVAKRLNIDLVLKASTPSDKLETTDDYSRAGWEVELRTVLQYPESLDITPEVRQELGLKQDAGQ